MGSNDAASNLKMKGAGAPALVAIATALNAADTLTKKIDKALESERARTVSEVAASTAKMFAVVGRNAVSSIGSVASGGREATADENREAPVQPEVPPPSRAAPLALISMGGSGPFGFPAVV